jgi:hypothetical protein
MRKIAVSDEITSDEMRVRRMEGEDMLRRTQVNWDKGRKKKKTSV